MNRELCIVLRDRLVGLPFIDLLGGMVQTLTVKDSVGDPDDLTAQPKIIVNKFPVTIDAIGAGNCTGPEIPMNPDSSRKSIIYFEDFGIQNTDRLHGNPGYNSSIRLVCWLNRNRLVGDAHKMVAGIMQSTIIGKIAGRNPQNIDIFTRLTVEVARILPQDNGIFARYTYDETVRQHLRPPYEFFAIDFTCKYYVPASCLGSINWNIEKTCP
jgi:hypothetical protein